MNPVSVTASFTAGSTTAIAGSQSPAGAGLLTLTATPVILTTAGSGLARQVLFTSSGDDTSATFTIVGTNSDGLPQTEALLGGNPTVTSALMYQTIISIRISKASAGTVSVGTNGVGASRVVMMDYFQNPFNVGIGCTLNSGAANYTVQHTFDDVFNTNATNWFSNSGITAKSANQDGNYAYAIRGIRLLINSGTGSVTMNLVQSTMPSH